MNARFYSLLMACLASLMVSGQAMAGQRFMNSGFVVRDDNAVRDFGRQEEREARKERQAEKRPAQEAEARDHEHGYGYGYERRNSPRQNDDRGRH